MPAEPAFHPPDLPDDRSRVELTRLEIQSLRNLEALALTPGRGVNVVLGPNGAGKTSLFDAVSGVVPAEGSVRFRGEELLGLPPHEVVRRGVARTFQLVRTFDGLSAMDNAVAGATFGAGLDDGAARRRAAESLSFVGLADAAEERAGGLTVAGRKRLELARALATDPDLVLIDEIASGLTPAEVNEVAALLGRLRDERGVAVVWIEHVVGAVMGAVDRVVVLSGGRTIAEGPPETVRGDSAVEEAYLGDPA